MREPKLAKAYDPKPVEAGWLERWEAASLFKAQPKSDRSKGDPFVIVIPPPNITGSLHMGHALNNVLQDSLTRFARMEGAEALMLPGTDHGGIATQNVLEKKLRAEGRSRQDLGRENFLKEMWDWRKQVGDTILMQLTKLGCAMDFSRKRFTMEDPCSSAVFEAFQRLWKKGVLYRGDRMINWCVRCGTALSDIEVEFEARKGKLWFLHYPAEDGGRGIVVATTRPETLLGDTAVAIPPNSKTWAHLEGKRVKLPLTPHSIPIVVDTMVDASFGMGAVKITPAHDPNDFATMERHPEIGSRTVIGFDGKMTPAAGEKYAGLARDKAREQVLADLEAGGFLEKVEDHAHSVPVCYRCSQVIEPLVSEQWFVRMADLAAPAAQAARDGKVVFHPESWKAPYVQWLEGIKDWCVSRQIWWGHRIPVWYCAHDLGEKIEVFYPKADKTAEKTTLAALLASGKTLAEVDQHALKVYVHLGGHTESMTTDPKSACGACGKKDWFQDPDVLDTWFSSALWPFSVMGWPQETADLKYFYPTTVLVTGYEILYLWVARMVMMGLEFRSQVPFSHVYIHGIVRDKRGKKMSKSLGNVVDPLVLMEKFGTDATRFSLILQATAGRDIQFAEDSPVGARNFANKLWNSTRFVLMNLPEQAGPIKYEEKDLELADRWILSEYRKMVPEVRRHMREYNPAAAAGLLYEFVWDKYCDWFIELAKIRLTGPEGKAKQTAQAVLLEIISGTLKLLHPFMPFITDELWQEIRPYVGGEEFLLREKLPAGGAADEDAAKEMALVMEATVALRTTRSLLNVPPGLKVKVVASGGKDADRDVLKKQAAYVSALARLEAFELANGGARPSHSATAMARGISLYVPLEGLIDFEKEKARLGKDMEKANTELTIVGAKLADANFMQRAPEAEVERVKGQQDAAKQKIERLKEVLASLG